MSKDKGQRVAKLGPITGWSQSDDGSTVHVNLLHGMHNLQLRLPTCSIPVASYDLCTILLWG